MSQNLDVRVRICPNCGAPLELDAEGRCHWCRAVLEIGPPGSSSPDSVAAASGVALPAGQVPARFRVVAVTRPGWRYEGEAVLVTGMLCGPLGVRLQQLTTSLPPAVWPVVGQELPAVADRKTGQWGEGSWPRGTGHGRWWRKGDWDPGLDGSHLRAVAGYLASIGCQSSDFAGLERRWPALALELNQACSRYFTVISGKDAVALMSRGVPAPGVVVGVRRLSSLPPEFMRLPGALMAWVTLDVTPQDGPPYRSTIRFGFRSEERFTALATLGRRLPLRIDPADRARVTIDLPALDITPA